MGVLESLGLKSDDEDDQDETEDDGSRDGDSEDGSESSENDSGENTVDEDIKEMKTQMDQVSERMDDIEQENEILKSKISEVEDKNEDMEQNISNLTAIYDFVVSHINPLVDQDISSIVPDMSGNMNPDIDLEDVEARRENGMDIEDRIDTDKLKDRVVDELKDEIRADVMEEVNEMDMVGSDQRIDNENHGSMNEEDRTTENAEVRKPRIDSKSGSLESEVLLMEWISLIVENYSLRMLISCVEYYNDIGWISDEHKREIDLRTSLVYKDEKYRDDPATEIPEELHRTNKLYLKQLFGD